METKTERPRNGGKRWSEAQLLYLTKQFERGLSPEHIAEDLERTEWVVVMKLHAQGKLTLEEVKPCAPSENAWQGFVQRQASKPEQTMSLSIFKHLPSRA